MFNFFVYMVFSDICSLVIPQAFDKIVSEHGPASKLDLNMNLKTT